MRGFGLMLAGIAALASVPAAAQTIAITGGRVVIGDGSEPIDNGIVVIRDGRVVAAGANVAIPAGARPSSMRTANGSRRASSPASRGSAWSRSMRSMPPTMPRPTGSPFSAAIDVAPGDQSAGVRDRDQPRRGRDPRRGLAIDRAQHLRRAGRGHRPRRRHAADHPRAPVPVHRARARTARATPAAAAPRRTPCCATRCARRASCACRSARADRRARLRPRRRRTCPIIPMTCCRARSGPTTCCSPASTRRRWCRWCRGGNCCSSMSSGPATSSRCWR